MNAETKTKAAAPTISVAMDDGRTVDFAGKRKMIKSSTVSESGEVVVRLDFVNGETRSYNIVAELMARFAAHGAEQKIGDEIAGVEDVEDCVAAIDELLIRLEKGEWNAKRDSNGMAGTSILAKALIEMTGKSKDDIMKFLSSKTHAEKIALRTNPKLKPIVERLESEKTQRSNKKESIDSDALLAGLGDEAVAEAEAA
jgi:hypothetical protein